MELSYYPGCTLKTKARNFEDSAIASMAALGVDLKEIPRWNCCGAVYCLADDDLIHQLAPVRDLIRMKELGQSKVAVLCSLCFNTLKRANLLMRNDAEKRKTLNSFMDEELDYNGEIEVVHLLEFLRDDIGWEAISDRVKVPLEGLKLAPYYGCTLLRPPEVAIDSVEGPNILHQFLQNLGAEPLDFPFAAKCCGGFQMVGNREVALESAWNILNSAVRWQAEALVLCCPLCDFNLADKQEELKRRYHGFKGIPTLYFTQLLALAFELDSEVCRFELNYQDPRPLLKSKGLL
jgi:heterodisulfide reductase subunit B